MKCFLVAALCVVLYGCGPNSAGISHVSSSDFKPFQPLFFTTEISSGGDISILETIDEELRIEFKHPGVRLPTMASRYSKDKWWWSGPLVPVTIVFTVDRRTMTVLDELVTVPKLMPNEPNMHFALKNELWIDVKDEVNPKAYIMVRCRMVKIAPLWDYTTPSSEGPFDRLYRTDEETDEKSSTPAPVPGTVVRSGHTGTQARLVERELVEAGPWAYAYTSIGLDAINWPAAYARLGDSDANTRTVINVFTDYYLEPRKDE